MLKLYPFFSSCFGYAMRVCSMLERQKTKARLTLQSSARVMSQLSNWLSPMRVSTSRSTSSLIPEGVGFSRDRQAASIESATMMILASREQGLGPGYR